MVPPKLQAMTARYQAPSIEPMLLAVPMTSETLLHKLMDVDRALDRADYAAARWILLEAEELTLRIQRETIEMQARLSASVAPAYRTVATGIKGRDDPWWRRNLNALGLRVGRVARAIVRDRQM